MFSYCAHLSIPCSHQARSHFGPPSLLECSGTDFYMSHSRINSVHADFLRDISGAAQHKGDMSHFTQEFSTTFRGLTSQNKIYLNMFIL